MDDDQLIRRCLEGDTEAFAGLVARYERPLYNVALRMLHDREEARDATQSAFVKAWQHLERFDPQHRFFSWIYRILLNDALNRAKRRRPTDPLDAGLVAGERSPEASAEQGQLEAVVTAALTRLDDEHRQVIVLRHWLDMSYDEMGQLLGIPDKTVKSRLFSARRRLGEILKERGVHSS